MKYLNSIYTPELSGKQGGVVFSSNQWGKYTAMRKTPNDPKSEAQQIVRAGTRMIGNLWKGISKEERQRWREFAKSFSFQKKGKTYFLTGYTFFQKLNRNLYEIEEALITNPPEINSDKNAQQFYHLGVKLVKAGKGKDLLLYQEELINANTKLKLSASKPVSASELYGWTKLYKIGVLDRNFVSGSSIKDLYINKYDTLPGKNQTAFFNIKATNVYTGFANALISAELIFEL